MIKVENFAKNLVSNFDIGESVDKTKFGVTIYSTEVKNLISLKDPDSSIKNKIISTIETLHDTKGWTNTAGALEHIRTQELTYGRSGIQQIIILITDGFPVLRRKKIVKEVYKEVSYIRTDFPDTILISIGIGKFNDKFLKKISNKNSKGESLVYHVSVDTLYKIVNSVSDEVCNKGDVRITKAPTPTPSLSPSEYLTPRPTTVDCSTIKKKNKRKKCYRRNKL